MMIFRRFLWPLLLCFALSSAAQIKDSTQMNMDAVYSRPFMQDGNRILWGGYAEGNWQYLGTDGVSDGHQFQFRRLTLFMASGITKNIRFMSELEIEDGGKELAIEFAAVDVFFTPWLQLRSGIILNPIGSFNQNHDGPKWEFTDRPLVSSTLLPATWSNAGFGLFGKTYQSNWTFGYEFYLSGGFDGSVISNAENRTNLSAAKENPERFNELHSGKPLYTAKLATKYKDKAEMGVSYMGGQFSKSTEDGLSVNPVLKSNVWAFDFRWVNRHDWSLTGEAVFHSLNIPETYSQQYGDQQWGYFADLVIPLIKKPMLGWKNARVLAAFRSEYVDYNFGKFKETGGNIGDHVWKFSPAICFRPTDQTVFRLNYIYSRQTDLFQNPPALTGGFQIGLSTYF